MSKNAQLVPVGPFQKLRPRLTPASQIVAKATEAELLSLIERLALKIEPVLAKSIMGYLETLKGGVDLQALADALQTGDVGKVIGLLAAVDTGAAKAKAVDAIQTAVWGGAAVAAAEINSSISGVIRAPPPTPVSPTSRPVAKPATICRMSMAGMLASGR